MSIKYNIGRFNKLIIMGLALFIFSGCEKDFLNELPTGAVAEATFWKTEEDAHGGLMGVYSTFYHSYAERVQDLDKSMAWMCAFAGYGSWRNFGWSRGDQLDITSGPPIALWPACYKHISQANNFLQNIEKVNMDNGKKAEMSAEVRFLRSFTYFWLSQTFGNVPLELDLKLEVWDSPNSAGVVIDAVRCCKLAMEQGLSGALEAPSAYFMKSPPRQFKDHKAKEMLEEFVSRGVSLARE